MFVYQNFNKTTRTTEPDNCINETVELTKALKCSNASTLTNLCSLYKASRDNILSMYNVCKIALKVI